MHSLFAVLLLITSSSSNPSQTCPDLCLCYDSSNLVECRGQELATVPHGLPHSTWMLDFRHNNLSRLEPDYFHALWSLRILLLSDNCIEIVSPKSFRSLGFLERLDLSYNLIASLPNDFSRGLGSLRELRVPSNRLTSLNYESLRHLESLEKLDLSQNYLSSMEHGLFRGLSRLRHLHLQSNLLDEIRGGYFFMLQNLELLNLSDNNISGIAVESFTSLHSLRLLSLSENQLSHLKFKTFLNLQTSSTHIQVSGNPWMCDCDLQRVFGKITSVRHLHIDDYDNLTCEGPPQLSGAALASVDNQLCVAETATVLVITITVLVTVIAAIVMAERNRKKNQEKNWNEPDGPFETQDK
ncbi:insulin-like growth factor-binding protein complex acid labile subunit [Bombina bombina]|uniref:insulin-like growth factor-binding protein complex acid labile subunit n=1 Tax=Bombina bombina TaxID=8345 RepID=UPI00235A4C93|nr:insulin-like growth factor-binding protein complex acid labile subunit [Bombina bombina]